jgi:hypothetical protein
MFAEALCRTTLDALTRMVTECTVTILVLERSMGNNHTGRAINASTNMM